MIRMGTVWVEVAEEGGAVDELERFAAGGELVAGGPKPPVIGPGS
jgi:hypothetical protein